MTYPDIVRATGFRVTGLAAVALAAMIAMPNRANAQAGPTAPTNPSMACATRGQDLILPPNLPVSASNTPSVLAVTEEFQRIPTSVGGAVTCTQQLVRVFQGAGLPPAPSATPPAPSGVADPIPGPTLRARVGDVVQLGFVNKVDSSRFDQSIDVDACMTVGQGGARYPGAGANQFDVAPNCLHASSTTNMHFHGTHTSPNTTADNVYLQVRPLPRDNQGKLTTTPEQAMVAYGKFFADCTAQLKPNPLNPWPARWADMPTDWITRQTDLLKAYQVKNPSQPLWDLDAKYIHDGWPQYYIGSVPYCFALPSKPVDQPVGTGPLRMGQAPGTHWYHAHKHGSTAINIENGMTGAFVIEGKYDDDITAAYADFTLQGGKPWTMRDQPVLVLNQLGTTPKLLTGVGPAGPAGIDFEVNGRLQPVVHMQPGEVQVWRIVNSSARNAVYLMGPPAGFHWRQLAQDGVQLANNQYRASTDRALYVAPGNRVDLLVQGPAASPGANAVPVQMQSVMGRAEVVLGPTAPGATLMSVLVSGEPVKHTGQPAPMELLPTAPEQPKFLADITDAELERSNFVTKRLVFDSKGPKSPQQHTINGIQFTGGEAEMKVFLGNVEEWKIENTTNVATGPGIIDHPFHIHVNPFQITEVFDPNEQFFDKASQKALPRYVPPGVTPIPGQQCVLDPDNKDTWKPCIKVAAQNLIWWDTFAIPSGLGLTGKAGDQVIVPGYFKMRSRFVDYPGYYVLHCHILVHEDRGMMFSVEVTKAAPMNVTHH